MTAPQTLVIFVDDDGDEFAVSVFGALSHDEAIAVAEQKVREFVEQGGWRPTGKPVYRRMQEGS